MSSYKHAVVIGGSLAGLMAAKALSETFDKVTVMDRDRLFDGPEVRKGTPQAAHVHVLLEAGLKIMDKFYPGLFEELQSHGVNLIDTADQLAWYHHGVWKMRYKSSIKMSLATRGFLEWNIRKKTEQVQNIQIMNETEVSELLSSQDNKSITGVKMHKVGKPADVSDVQADLVVDASGRGSRAPTWLTNMGYQAPREEAIIIDLSYTSRMYEKPPGFQEDWKFFIHHTTTPETWRSGFISAVEGNKWLVSLNGYFKESAPMDDAGFLEFASTLTQPQLYNYIKNAKPISDFKIHKVPGSRWRHFEKLSRFPENLINLGDSVTAFNPIFGQGMTAVAKSVRLLHTQMNQQKKKSPASLKGLSNRFRKALPSVLKVPWLLATILDLNYPQAIGKKPLGHGFLVWYVGKMLEASSVNKVVFSQFNEILHLKQGLWVILKPSVALRLFAYGIKSIFMPLDKWANTSHPPYELNDSGVTTKDPQAGV